MKLANVLTIVLTVVACPAPAADIPALPGMSWSTLDQLPDLLNVTWVPESTANTQTAVLAAMKLPPLKPAYQTDAKQQIASIVSGRQQSLAAQCRLEGMPTLAWYPYPLQFLYAPGTVIIKESVTYRSLGIGTSLEHPKSLYDPNALQNFGISGDTTATWQGDTLVADTVKLREDRDTFYGAPNDPDIRIVERYKLLDHDTLERDTTITSPLAFTAPWHTRTLYRRAPAGSLASTICMRPGEPVT